MQSVSSIKLIKTYFWTTEAHPLIPREDLASVQERVPEAPTITSQGCPYMVFKIKQDYMSRSQVLIKTNISIARTFNFLFSWSLAVIFQYVVHCLKCLCLSEYYPSDFSASLLLLSWSIFALFTRPKFSPKFACCWKGNATPAYYCLGPL